MSGKEQAEAHEGDAKPKKSKKKLVIIAVVLLVLLGGGIGFVVMGKSKTAEGEEEAKEEVRVLATAKLDTFIVNLSGSGSFLKITMLLEYDPKLLGEGEHGGGSEGGGGGHGGGGGGGGEGAEGGGMPGTLGKREPMIRDAVIRVLSGKKGEEVLTTEGKEALKDELVEAINESIGLEEGPIVAVYFTEFIVQ